MGRAKVSPHSFAKIAAPTQDESGHRRGTATQAQLRRLRPAILVGGNGRSS